MDVANTATKWRVFKPKDEKHHYIVSADASGGKDGGNDAASWVIDIETHEQVAAFNETVEPKAFAIELVKKSREYNDAIVAVEAEKYGLIVISELLAQEINIYYHTMKSTGMRPTSATEFGWNPRYKEEAVTRMIVDFGYNNGKPLQKNAALKIYDRDTLLQMSTFVRQKNKTGDGFKIGAAKKKKDDLVSAGYIGNYVWHEIKDWYTDVEEIETMTPREKYEEKLRADYLDATEESDFWTEEEDES